MRGVGLTRALLVGSAIATALFWALAAVIGSFAGAAAVRHALWTPSQILHVIGALLVIPAIPELTFFARRPGSPLAIWGSALAMIGSALFAADGVIALCVYPVIAANARDLIEPYGAMNRGMMLATWIAISAVCMIGWIVFGAALWKGRAPAWAVALLVAGAVLFNLPPAAVPVFVLAIGGVLWSVAIMRFALDQSFSAPADTAPLRRIRPRTPPSAAGPSLGA